MLVVACLLLTLWAVTATIFLWKFAKIILIIENDLSNAIEVLQDAEKTMNDCLELPMFFDSPQVQMATKEALDQIRVAKVAVAGLVTKFVAQSKQKYIEVVEDVERE